MPAIPATQEAEVGGSHSETGPHKSMQPYLKKEEEEERKKDMGGRERERKKKERRKARCMAQVVECLSSKYKTLSSKPRTEKKIMSLKENLKCQNIPSVNT
jgi:hypothetical protein